MVGFEETLGQYEEYLLASREFFFPDHFVMLWINFEVGGGGCLLHPDYDSDSREKSF